ncbi:MAG TPA: GNAT family N-acetyltransferase [Polyangia bacterium]|nr:GNAT family N-acetyltransferase [Polyangia bacterium]
MTTTLLDVRIVPARADEQASLRHLIDLYAYDFSALLGLDVGDDGRFAFRDLAPFWTDDWRHAFFVKAGDKLAGFALVEARSRLSGEPGVHDMAEFFILRKYRRQGVGERAACLVFQRFPGRWEVRQRAENADATVFWRRVIDRYTGGIFEDVVRADAAWRGPVQSFRR